jgi:hypothetical protein
VGIKRIPLCLNTEDPEQKELFDFVSFLPNGKKRNSSAFLKLLLDREYQKKRVQYLAEKAVHEKETPKAPHVKVFKSGKGEIKYLAKDVNQNTD